MPRAGYEVEPERVPLHHGMRILAFNYEYPPLGGGGGVVFKDLYDELSKRHQVTIVTTHFGDLPRHEVRGTQSIHRVSVWRRTHLSTATMLSMLTYPLTSWRRGRSLLSKGPFDVVTSHFVVPTALSAQVLASSFKVPHVLNVLGGDLYDPSKKQSPHRVPVVRSVVRSCLKRADRVVAGSTDTAENAQRLYRADRSIDVIPLGIVAPELAEASRASLGVGADRFVMATVGRLVARKGLEDLIRVVHELQDPRDLVLVIGEGPAREPLEALVRELGVENKVMFRGRVSEKDKWGLLGISDLYVSTTLHEGFGLVFLEAMHSGLPVVCYDRGGQTDFLEDGKTGLLVPHGKTDAFVDAVRRIKADRALAKACAAFNRERVKAFYIDGYAMRHEELFEEVVREKLEQRVR